ncbi:hypothetical protein Q5P01_014474 [Channa striata]|uniref:Uncharacterized protein n=1 Tax=Channa striata TaxID=64152 RepID=A0AA88SHT3_CHASR|nr:hypothetical protein Q5P01_014474 [Channa striata]
MVHDDLRVEWIRQRVSAGFNLSGCPNSFDELLNKNDGEEEQKIFRFLNVVSEEDSSSCLFFFKTIKEVEIEVEIPVEIEEDAESLDADELSRSQSGEQLASYSEEAEQQSLSHRTEIQLVYRTKLHVAVNEYPQRFLNPESSTFFETQRTIVEPLDMNEANVLLPRLFDIGMQSGDPYRVLQNSLANVFIPLLTAHQMKEIGGGYQSRAASPSNLTGEEPSPPKSSEQFTVRDELLHRTYKFLGVLNTTIQHLEFQEGIMLHIPELDLEPDVNVLLSNSEIVEDLDQCVRNWQTHITIVIEEQQNKRPQAPGPMAEIAFGRTVRSSLVL